MIGENTCMIYKICNGLVDIPFNGHLKLVNSSEFYFTKTKCKTASS